MKTIEAKIVEANQQLDTAARKLSNTKYQTATQYKEALQEWLMAKCAVLEAYRDQYLSSDKVESWNEADRLAKAIGAYNEVESRLIHTITL